MPRIALTGGAYQARSLIAAAQRCVNLYPEPVPDDQGEPVKVVHNLTPGLRQVAAGAGMVRGEWLASNGLFFVVIGGTLYTFSGSTLTGVTTIPVRTTPVSMADNGFTLALVDGSTAGWWVYLTTLAVTPIVDPSFYGADRVDFVDTFFIFNRPGTPQWYVGDSNATTFDPLYIASKTGSSDNLQTLIVCHREIWLIGTISSEVWFNAGATDFPFSIVPGAFIEQGTCAKYSVAKAGSTVLWLSQNRNGERYVVQGENYQAKRISTFAIEEALRGYAVVSDAIGYCYQQGGHGFYVLTFPTGDATWVYDLNTGIWHERLWSDAQGALHRHRGVCAANWNGAVYVGDQDNGAIYELDPDTFTDNGAPIVRVRTFPHMVEDADRIVYRQFIADMEVGNIADFSNPQVSLRWSNDRGQTWGNPVMMSVGTTGNYLLSMQVQRLGMARDRVFEVSWSVPVRTSLTGAFIEVIKAAS